MEKNFDKFLSQLQETNQTLDFSAISKKSHTMLTISS